MMPLPRPSTNDVYNSILKWTGTKTTKSKQLQSPLQGKRCAWPLFTLTIYTPRTAPSWLPVASFLQNSRKEKFEGACINSQVIKARLSGKDGLRGLHPSNIGRISENMAQIGTQKRLTRLCPKKAKSVLYRGSNENNLLYFRTNKRFSRF